MYTSNSKATWQLHNRWIIWILEKKDIWWCVKSYRTEYSALINEEGYKTFSFFYVKANYSPMLNKRGRNTNSQGLHLYWKSNLTGGYHESLFT